LRHPDRAQPQRRSLAPFSTRPASDHLPLKRSQQETPHGASRIRKNLEFRAHTRQFQYLATESTGIRQLDRTAQSLKFIVCIEQNLESSAIHDRNTAQIEYNPRLALLDASMEQIGKFHGTVAANAVAPADHVHSTLSLLFKHIAICYS
jgi:hypothetical protein